MFSQGAREAYAFLQIMEGRLARDETIVEAELLEGRRALQIVKAEIKKEQQQFKAEVVEGFRFQQAQQDVDVQTSEVRDQILEKEVLGLRERLEIQKQEWTVQIKEQNDNAFPENSKNKKYKQRRNQRSKEKKQTYSWHNKLPK